MEGAGGNSKAKKQFDDELEGAGEPQIFSLAGCRLELSKDSKITWKSWKHFGFGWIPLEYHKTSGTRKQHEF